MAIPRFRSHRTGIMVTQFSKYVYLVLVYPLVILGCAGGGDSFHYAHASFPIAEADFINLVHGYYEDGYNIQNDENRISILKRNKKFLILSYKKRDYVPFEIEVYYEIYTDSARELDHFHALIQQLYDLPMPPIPADKFTHW